MHQTHRTLLQKAATWILTAAAGACLAVAPATAQERSSSLELGAGLGYTSKDGVELQTLALRWGYDFNPTWGIEVAASSDDLDDLDDSNRYLDLAVRYTFLKRGDWEVFTFFGAGLLTYQDIRFTFRDDHGFIVQDNGDRDTPTLLGGIGARWSFTDRLYLRPELRYRNPLDTGDDPLEGTVALGWRF